MRCPKCHSQNTAVIDSRDTDDSTAIRRRRKCLDCEYRFTTFERQRTLELMVEKRDGTHEPYDRQKLEHSIWIACIKRPVERAAIDRIIATLEDELVGVAEAKSEEIGNHLLAALSELDEVSYLRYLSVFRKFQHASDFSQAAEHFSS